MKPIVKGPCPQPLSDWAIAHPDASWEQMRNDNGDGGNAAYKECRKKLWDDQQHICAYCECSLPDDAPHNWRVEHFHPKSDRKIKNWDLDWRNLLLVCLGGQKDGDPLPENLSCDGSKGNTICDKIMLNPLDLPPFPPVFVLDKSNGSFAPNESFCQQHPKLFDNISTHTVLENTIRILNLNCYRLRTLRLHILHALEKDKKQMREKHILPSKGLATLAEKHLKLVKPFFSTRRLCLGESAEKYLRGINFKG